MDKRYKHLDGEERGVILAEHRRGASLREIGGLLGLGLGGRVPDAKTVWLYREALAQAGMVEALFSQFDGYMARQGYIARGGQILDASTVPVPRNHNTREENKAIKAGEVPEDWADKPAKRSQKDMDARWTQKYGKSHYGYKNHVNADRKRKLVRRYHVSDAAQHDSQAVDHLMMQGNTGSGVWADAAYRSEEMEAKLRALKLKSHIHRKGKRGKPLTEQAKGSNRTKSSVRVRVEHIFGAQSNDMGGTLVRTIGMVRAKARIGMKNLAYDEADQELIRGINSPPNTPPRATGPSQPVPGMKEESPDIRITPQGGTDRVQKTARQSQNHPPARPSAVHCQLQTGSTEVVPR